MFYFLRRGGIFANVRLYFLGGEETTFFFFSNEYFTTNDPLLQQEFVISIKGIRLFCHRFHPVAADPPEITGRALGLPPSGHLWHCNHKFHNCNCGSESSNKKEGGKTESFRGEGREGGGGRQVSKYSKHDRVRNERRRFLKVRCLIREPRRSRARHQTLDMKEERKVARD